jgi:uncharacterized protein (TIGR03437 family)
VTVTVDGYTAPVIYAGDASGMVEGIVQINVRLPKYASEGGVQVMVGNNWMGFGISIAGN